MWIIIWDNEHASGVLAGEYPTEEAADTAGRDWLHEICAIDGLDPDADNCPYSYEVVEREPAPDPEEEHDEMGELRKAALSRGQP